MSGFVCDHCGRPAGDFDGGGSGMSVLDGNGNSVSYRFCHPNAKGRPDCYRLVTERGEKIGSRKHETAGGPMRDIADTLAFLAMHALSDRDIEVPDKKELRNYLTGKFAYVLENLPEDWLGDGETKTT
jgi:hypothetical protein